MKKQNAAASQPKESKAPAKPMAKGMAKKMMGQMAPGGGPMMAQMSHGKGKPPMGEMMGMNMCSEMMAVTRQTIALAVYATPELQKTFSEWLKELEDRAVDFLANGAADAADLAQSLNITEDSALYVFHRLAASGKITLAGRLRQ